MTSTPMPLASAFSVAPVVWLLLLAGASYLSKRRRTQRASAAPAKTRPAAMEDEERTQRVREEVRRRIAERRAQAGAEAPPVRRAAESPAPPAPKVAPAPGTMGDLFDTIREAVAGPQEAPVVSETVDQAEAELQQTLARQRELEDKNRMLAAAVNAPRAGELRAGEIGAAPALPQSAISPWLRELRDPASFRKAVLLREVLGPPVALRR